MSNFDPTKYGPVLADLVTSAEPMSLDAGGANIASRPALSALSLESAFKHVSIVDTDMARCCLSGVWLLHNFLDESHTISQGISTPSGSYWHGIMHRREGDYSNAKYWMRRVGEHPVFDEMAEHSQNWDPFSFVDDCERAVGSGNQAEISTLRSQQHLEWQMLFDFCYQAAVGR